MSYVPSVVTRSQSGKDRATLMPFDFSENREVYISPTQTLPSLESRIRMWQTGLAGGVGRQHMALRVEYGGNNIREGATAILDAYDRHKLLSALLDFDGIVSPECDRLHVLETEEEVEPTCDLCGFRMQAGACGMGEDCSSEYHVEWNGETGNHVWCEEARDRERLER